MVEVRGVEPRSEEKTLKTSTYLARLLIFARGNSGPGFRDPATRDRQDWPHAIRGVPAFGGTSSGTPRSDAGLSHLSRRSFPPRWAKSG